MFDGPNEGSEPAKKPGFPRAPTPYRITTDLPDPLPVTAAELDMLEHQFAALIDELLKEA